MLAVVVHQGGQGREGPLGPENLKPPAAVLALHPEVSYGSGVREGEGEAPGTVLTLPQEEGVAGSGLQLQLCQLSGDLAVEPSAGNPAHPMRPHAARLGGGLADYAGERRTLVSAGPPHWGASDCLEWAGWGRKEGGSSPSARVGGASPWSSPSWVSSLRPSPS